MIAFLLLILGAASVVGCFFVPGAVGIALAAVGCILLYCATIAALKHIGWW